MALGAIYDGRAAANDAPVEEQQRFLRSADLFSLRWIAAAEVTAAAAPSAAAAVATPAHAKPVANFVDDVFESDDLDVLAA
jgi:hypothetical protein